MDIYAGKTDPPNGLFMNVSGLLQFGWSICDVGSKFSFLFAVKSSSYGLYDNGYSAMLQSFP